MLSEFLFFDTRTLLGVLFIGNLCLSLLVLAFRTTVFSGWERSYVDRCIRVRALYVIGFFLLYLRTHIPDILSVNVGNSLIFFAYYLEVNLMLGIVKRNSPEVKRLLQVLLVASLTVFNLAELIAASPNLRVRIASVIILAFHIIPAFAYTTSKGISRFRRFVGVFYGILVLSLIPRLVISFLDEGVWLHSNVFAQELFYLSSILLMMVSTTCQLLFIKEENDQVLEKMALTDQLTGIANRHSFLNAAERLLDRCRREHRLVTMIYLDVDYFKEVNDTYGHDFGDLVLAKVAKTLSAGLREDDLVCRYGGEEFLILFTSEDEESARQVAERIRIQQSAIRFSQKPKFRMSVSIGVCTRQANEVELQDLITQSDQALYFAKQAGRNQAIYR